MSNTYEKKQAKKKIAIYSSNGQLTIDFSEDKAEELEAKAVRVAQDTAAKELPQIWQQIEKKYKSGQLSVRLQYVTTLNLTTPRTKIYFDHVEAVISLPRQEILKVLEGNQRNQYLLENSQEYIGKKKARYGGVVESSYIFLLESLQRQYGVFCELV